ncbi:MAG TPA: hypothetical protein PKI36_08005, partial [Turneriella sp.]|nr:hypothetical protein [Turneriella sp.]
MTHRHGEDDGSEMTCTLGRCGTQLPRLDHVPHESLIGDHFIKFVVCVVPRARVQPRETLPHDVR